VMAPKKVNTRVNSSPDEATKAASMQSNLQRHKPTTDRWKHHQQM
jgi:hypothetical protein